MSGGITDPVEKPHKDELRIVQGTTAGMLREAMKDLPENARIGWVDYYTPPDGGVTHAAIAFVFPKQA